MDLPGNLFGGLCAILFSRYAASMTEIESELLRALREFDQAVRSIKTAQPKPNLMEHFARLDGLTVKLPRGTDGDLLHYMHKKSYEKALALLQERA